MSDDIAPIYWEFDFDEMLWVDRNRRWAVSSGVINQLGHGAVRAIAHHRSIPDFPDHLLEEWFRRAYESEVSISA